MKNLALEKVFRSNEEAVGTKTGALKEFFSLTDEQLIKIVPEVNTELAEIAANVFWDTTTINEVKTEAAKENIADFFISDYPVDFAVRYALEQAIANNSAMQIAMRLPETFALAEDYFVKEKLTYNEVAAKHAVWNLVDMSEVPTSMYETTKKLYDTLDSVKGKLSEDELILVTDMIHRNKSEFSTFLFDKMVGIDEPVVEAEPTDDQAEKPVAPVAEEESTVVQIEEPEPAVEKPVAEEEQSASMRIEEQEVEDQPKAEESTINLDAMFDV